MKNGQCNNPMVLEGCPKSCGKCSDTSSLSKEICKDDSVQCPLVFQQGQCSVGEYAKFCRKSCNLCTTAAQGSLNFFFKRLVSRWVICMRGLFFLNLWGLVFTIHEINPVATFIIGNTPCKDKTTQCASLKTMGQCSNAIVAESCKVTCGLCNNAAGTDEFSNSFELIWGTEQDGKIYAEFTFIINDYFIFVGSACRDETANCNVFVGLNQCSNPAISKVCAKSCNLCNSPGKLLMSQLSP